MLVGQPGCGIMPVSWPAARGRGRALTSPLSLASESPSLPESEESLPSPLSLAESEESASSPVSPLLTVAHPARGPLARWS
jgi:hypothetical protein